MGAKAGTSLSLLNIFHITDCHKEQKKETRKGTLKSVRTPQIRVAGIISGPQLLVIPGKQTSIEVAPAAATAAYGPSLFARKGVNIKAISSLKILESNAIVPKAVAIAIPYDDSLRPAIITDESE